MSDVKRRTYAVGLPVIFTVRDDGFVQVEVDLSEAGQAIRECDLDGNFAAGDAPPPTGEEIDADAAVVDRWTDVNMVKNEEFAPLTDREVNAYVAADPLAYDPRPEVFGWFDFQPEPEMTGDGEGDPTKHYLTIVADPGNHNEEIAVIVHREAGGKFPIDGELAEKKRKAAKWIVDALNAYQRERPLESIFVEEAT